MRRIFSAPRRKPNIFHRPDRRILRPRHRQSLPQNIPKPKPPTDVKRCDGTEVFVDTCYWRGGPRETAADSMRRGGGGSTGRGPLCWSGILVYMYDCMFFCILIRFRLRFVMSVPFRVDGFKFRGGSMYAKTNFGCLNRSVIGFVSISWRFTFNMYSILIVIFENRLFQSPIFDRSNLLWVICCSYIYEL